MSKRVYGYCRISRKTQNIERQVRNISSQYPEAIIRKEAYTGTKTEGRKVFTQILKEAKAGDVIVFDSVSRMSRNAAEGIEVYMELYKKGIELVFLKEPHINTETYKRQIEKRMEAIKTGDKKTDKFMNGFMILMNELIEDIAKEQIELAFLQAEKEVTDLHERTKEGIETARRNGKQIGREAGRTRKYDKEGNVTKSYQKAEETKKQIRKKAACFDGTLTDSDTMKILGISKRTYYKYKREILEEMEA